MMVIGREDGVACLIVSDMLDGTFELLGCGFFCANSDGLAQKAVANTIIDILI
jgi:hypothetical protein